MMKFYLEMNHIDLFRTTCDFILINIDWEFQIEKNLGVTEANLQLVFMRYI